ncbi:MAG: 30S ribosome-binding factor RbfA [Deltaproteobacteria bacterium]|nr:MAG: 30S ribosome-binding factor RbfA [Deltaproteobacteria bacterium]
MAGYRPKRVAEMIHRELAVRLPQSLKDPGLGFVSITHVEVTRDLGVARISWSPLGGGEPSPELVQAVDEASRALRGPIGRALRMRHAPELRFLLDGHTDAAVRMTTLLNEIRQDLDARDQTDEPEGEE